eukprot:SAG25_NODE_374_length_8940_cov_97.908155_13_plen_133_part_01
MVPCGHALSAGNTITYSSSNAILSPVLLITTLCLFYQTRAELLVKRWHCSFKKTVRKFSVSCQPSKRRLHYRLAQALAAVRSATSHISQRKHRHLSAAVCNQDGARLAQRDLAMEAEVRGAELASLHASGVPA